MKKPKPKAEFDFALIVQGVPALTRKVEDALYEAGCDDATLSMRYGRLYAEFSRAAASLKDAVLSAIRDVRKAKIGASVLRVDECELVSQAEIARRVGRSRQMIGQYLAGKRGPGGFPAPESRLAEGAPLWAWCAVSQWLAEHDLIRPEAQWDAAVVAAVNALLDLHRQKALRPDLLKEIGEFVNAVA